MIKIADLGTFKQVPPLVESLIAGDTVALEGFRTAGWDIEAAITLSDYIQERPLVLALCANAAASVHWLVSHGVRLNRADAPAFPIAARYTDPAMMRYLAQHGADVHAVRKVGGDAYMQALYGGKIEHLEEIHALGHAAAEHGGQAFRSAVFERKKRAVEFFLAHGVDVNFKGKDQVFSDSATPLLVAARNRDKGMCRLLVEHGADVLVTSRDGERPYTVALEEGDEALAAYFRSLEPVELHSVEHRLRELEPYKLPAEMLEFLQGEQRRVELPDCDFGFFEFFALTDIFPMKVGRRKVLRLSKESGDYTDVVLVWNPTKGRIGYWDIEHEEYADLATFKTFMANPAKYMNGVLDGDYQ
ncbi:ankyrin repeat domain-containing protein [Kerstersia sp.]|uniref:ankyrin repeat domain-containing protein n=1 Tax=Kerstersia sp. TaxID=1930783 RepID=UPI003F903B61